jgi:hypothetical protein
MKERTMIRLMVGLTALFVLNQTVAVVRDNRVAEARAATRIAVVRADSVLAAKALSDATIRQIVVEADTIVRRAQRAEARAIRSNEEYTRLRKQFAEIEPSASPDSIIAAADSALEAADSTIVELRSSLGLQIEATAKLRAALESEQAAHQETAGALTELRTSSTSLVGATRPSLIQRLLPKVSLGAAVGLDMTGRPNTVVGVTLSLP